MIATWTEMSEYSKDGELLFTEKMEIQFRKRVINFVTSISDQNDGKEIVFKTIENSGDKIVFENNKHDFPQLITYSKNHKDSIHAYISGEVNGIEQRIDFRMSKEK